jgi:hypothetical protein
MREYLKEGILKVGSRTLGILRLKNICDMMKMQENCTLDCETVEGRDVV